MLNSLPPRRLCACVFAYSLGLIMTPQAIAQTPDAPPDIVLTPNRGPTSIQRSGSSISVISGDELRRTGVATGLVDALRTVPGVQVTQSGGVSGIASVRLRGSSVGQVLVLIDGVRMNDPSSTSGEFDFSMIAPTDIERIEVLRGPQSALYGSDAIGGVINIITKRGQVNPRTLVSLGGGSYGTLEARAAVSGGAGPWRYALSATGLNASGYTAYGHRLPRLAAFGPFERDGASKIGASLRAGYQPHADFSVDASLSHFWTFARFDSSFADDRYNKSWSRVTNGQVSARLATLDGMLTHRLTGFAARTDRFYNFSAFFSPTGTGYDYFGTRYGVEYQGDLKLGAYGTLIFGLRYEREELEPFSEPLLRGSGMRRPLTAASMNTLSAFALHQIQLGDRLDLSLAGRIDAVERTNTFVTGRATLAYRLVETGTRFRASIGTGAKSPTLYQLYSEYGNLALRPETSLGYDAGIEQNVLGDRVRVSLGVFENRFRDFINFGSNAACNALTQAFGCYFNTGRARTRGIEMAFSARLIEDQLTLRGSYTFLDALDRQTGLRLTRRAMHQGAIGLDWRPIDKLTLSPSLVMIGARADEDFDRNFNRIRVRLAPYARLDLAANYQLTSQLSLYGRAENLLGARIEEVRNYGGTGRAFYGGVQAEW